MTLNVSTCHNCGHNQLSRLFEVPAFDSDDHGQFPVERCDLCGVVNTLGVTDEVLQAAYSQAYYGDARSKFSLVMECLLDRAATKKARRLIRQWQRGETRKSPRVLDIGCGRGVLLQAFRAEGASVQGIERDEFPGRPEFVHIGAISDARFDDDKFDIVVIWHVLEHLTDIDATFKRIADILAPDGLLVFAVPNFDSLQRTWFSQSWFHLDAPRHLLHFEPEWLKQHLIDNGLSITDVSHFDLVQNPYGFVQSAMNRFAPSRTNEYYEMLKQNGVKGPAFLGWTLLAVLLAPFAVLETLLGSIKRRGATITVTAKPTTGTHRR